MDIVEMFLKELDKLDETYCKLGNDSGDEDMRYFYMVKVVTVREIAFRFKKCLEGGEKQ